MDRVLDREVALTIIDGVSTQLGRSSVNEVFARTVALGQVRTAAVASVLDMVDGASFSAVVAEWIPSVSVDEASAGSTSVLGVARAVVELAAAMRGFHESGSVLAIGDSGRVRVSLDGIAYVAFPGTPASSERDSDIRGFCSVVRTLAAGVQSPDALGLMTGRDGQEVTAVAITDTLQGIVDQPLPRRIPFPHPSPMQSLRRRVTRRDRALWPRLPASQRSPWCCSARSGG
ncbi:hypothetical protein [Rhodococcus sp. MTM3W5.2]|uniref:hypothetical protein n=1 Tax=Rhodococcus sp. MTM3W5.2 TaxID=1805827 RepID=UPI00097C2297|nr:hypothetical protein [Rhodococcus sp. MTM3W5.2]